MTIDNLITLLLIAYSANFLFAFIVLSLYAFIRKSLW